MANIEERAGFKEQLMALEIEPVVPKIPKLDHISHSQLALWQGCPRQWQYVYVDKLPRGTSAALILGNCYHATLEEYFKMKLLLGQDPDIDILLDFFSTQWNKMFFSAWDIDFGKSSRGEQKDLGIALLSKYMEEIAPTIIPAQVELEMECVVHGVTFVLRCDLITTGNIVIDHKTSAKHYTQAQVDADSQASATAYALHRPIVFQNHVAVKTKIPDIQIMRTYRTHADINWWYRKASAMVVHMQSGYAPPNEDYMYCSPKLCKFFDICKKDLARSIST